MVGWFAAAYLAGSLPFAYWWTELFSGRDIRKIGSRNAGTANVWKTSGLLPAILTALGDGLKGVAVAQIGLRIPSPLAGYALPSLAIAGHNWPVWLRFRGGGGLATFIGSSLVMTNWEGTLAAVGLWGLTYLLLRDHDRSALLACFLVSAFVPWVGQSCEWLVFYGSSSLVIALKRVQSMWDKRRLKTAVGDGAGTGVDRSPTTA